MSAALTAEAFTKLLARLDPDRERAGEKYEELRRTLVKFFEWRGAPFPEDQADETFNRVARKLDEGRGQSGRRRALAEALGLRREALANRAQRLRDKLEECVTRCSKKKRA